MDADATLHIAVGYGARVGGMMIYAALILQPRLT